MAVDARLQTQTQTQTLPDKLRACHGPEEP